MAGKGDKPRKVDGDKYRSNYDNIFKKTMENPIKLRFLRDIKDHVLEILRDDGVYRHIKVAKPGCFAYSFEIITFPGYLCYVGDMGSYTFCRLNDMFEFFRDPKGELGINRGYWAEKVQAMDRYVKLKEFSSDIFEKSLLEQIKEMDIYSKELEEAFREDVLEAYDSLDEINARETANSFRFNGEEVFYDLWDYDFQDYTYHFTWCCYAIVWAIQKYDEKIQNKKI